MSNPIQPAMTTGTLADRLLGVIVKKLGSPLAQAVVEECAPEIREVLERELAPFDKHAVKLRTVAQRAGRIITRAQQNRGPQ